MGRSGGGGNDVKGGGDSVLFPIRSLRRRWRRKQSKIVIKMRRSRNMAAVREMRIMKFVSRDEEDGSFGGSGGGGRGDGEEV